LLPIVLIILYFLRLKRKPLQVPSTFLWKKSIEDMHVNSLFQWLRNNVLLILQILVLLFLIYSVLGLRIHGSTESAQNYILMIDNSASMSVKDVAPSRLEWAKLEAFKEIEAAGPSDSGMVIVFNSKATTLQTYTNDKVKLREAIASIQPTQRPTRIEEALAFASSLANPVRSTEDLSMQPTDVPDDQKRTFVQERGVSTVVHVYSDGRFAKLSEAALTGMNLRLAGNDPRQGGLIVRYHRAGVLEEPGNSDNLAVVGLNVLKQPEHVRKNLQPTFQHLIAFVRLANFRSEPASIRVVLSVYVDGVRAHQLEQVKEVKARKFVEGKEDDDDQDDPGEAEIRFNLPPLEPRRNIALHAVLDKHSDAFPLDDQAWLVVSATRKAKVLIVGPPNKVLDSFFDPEPVKKVAVVERMPAADLKGDVYRKKARSGEFDLVIFDRCAPDEEADMPLSNTFFIDRPPPPWERSKDRLKNPLLMPSKLQHPLLSHITTIMDVRTDEAFVFDVKKNLRPSAAGAFDLPDGDPKKRTLPTIARVIESSNQAPILFTMPRGPHTDLVLTFPIMDDDGGLPSDWFGKPSFPLFFRNVLYILGNVDDSVRSISVQAGEPVVLRPEAGFRFIQMTTPAKQSIKLPRSERGDVTFAETDALGIYRYTVGARDDDKDLDQDVMRGFAVNLLDVNESNIEPRASLRIGSERVPAGAEKSRTREIWKWILLLAVVLLISEWFIYQRRIAV
jgi:hypothetical protein